MLGLKIRFSDLEFRISGSFRGRSIKKWNKVIRKDLKERKLSKDLAKDGNTCRYFIRNRPNPRKHEKRALQ